MTRRRWLARLPTSWMVRGSMVCAVAANVVAIFYGNPGWWWMNAICILIVAASWVRWEVIHRRYGPLPSRDDINWELASRTDNPIAAMAQFEYMDTLSTDEVKQVGQWFKEQNARARNLGAHEVEVDADDMPPAVRGFFEVVTQQPPQEL